jgi:hypothetical protein
LLLNVPHGVEITIILGEIAEAFFDYGSFEGAIGLELKAGGAADGIEVGG